MNAKTLNALKQSIEHWERLATGKQKTGEGFIADDCALCDLFNPDHPMDYGERCRGCPVMVKTETGECIGSPWRAAYMAGKSFGLGSVEFMAAAKLELNFLKSLLPKKGKK